MNFKAFESLIVSILFAIVTIGTLVAAYHTSGTVFTPLLIITFSGAVTTVSFWFQFKQRLNK